MDYSELGQDRFLRKDPNQSDQTKDAVYAAANPAPKRGDDAFRKAGRPKGSEEDDGAPNILTGTVIVSCFIQTSALPSRIELQGNDITFFDDSYAKDSSVLGDTSRIVFTHASAKAGEKITEGFIIEKRASSENTYDNVLSIFALEPRSGAMNNLNIGLRGNTTNLPQINSIQNAINHSTTPVTLDALNGIYVIAGAKDGVLYPDANFAVGWNSLFGVSGDGYSVYMRGEGSGVVLINSQILPFSPGINIGAPGKKFGTFYGSVSACPLPTVENALELLEKIPDPSFVGERGHYGEDRKYFDDVTFPAELLYTGSDGNTDIEHNHILGFLLKAIIELKREVDFLKNQT